MPTPQHVLDRAAEARRMLAGHSEAAPSDEQEDVSDTPEAESPSHNVTPQDPATENTVPTTIDPEDWKARFTQLRMARDERLVAAQAREAQLQQEITTLQAEVARLTESVTSDHGSSANSLKISDEDREIIGDTEADTLERLAGNLSDRIATVEARETQSDQARREMVFADLDSMIPGWRETNSNPAFIAWLNEVDPATGFTQKSSLDYGMGQFDSKVVGNVFRSYMKKGAEAPVQEPRSEAPVEPEVRVSSGEELASNTYEVFTNAEIAAFYEARGKLARERKLVGKVKEESDAMDLKLRRAMAEGRTE